MHIRATCLLLMIATAAVAGDPVDFQRDVQPILREHCTGCHGPDESESHLRLDSMLNAARGGDSGETAIVPGHSNKSYLIELVTHRDPSERMPPDSEPLPPEQIDILRRWIDDAPQWKAVQKLAAHRETDHWSFQPVTRPAIPSVGESHPVDAFIQARLQQTSLSRNPPASRRRLIRRLLLVMHGLPPTPDQVQGFVDDRRPDAWKRLMEDVLASPRYGERWGQHWLDLARFGETTGFETNRERPHAWPYRDWVIEAFNRDKPYDRFIIEQIAGDAVGARVGTAFLVAGPNDIVKGQDPDLRLMQRQDELADMINTTGTAFLGLTIGCARCHNHKFDPISQADYYAMQAVFAGVSHADQALPLSAETQQQITALSAEIDGLTNRLKKFVRRPDPSGKTRREAVTATENSETFPPVSARFVRFTINATNGGNPCIDELEIFSGSNNVGLAGAGAKAVSSGDFVHPLHKLKHINDGRYGNANSWISSALSGGWVQIELPQRTTVDRIVWQRDRQGKYSDRLATDYLIQASVDGKTWTPIAGSADRQPFRKQKSARPDYDFAAFAAEEAQQGQAWLNDQKEKIRQRTALMESKKVYAGTFSQPGATHRLYRGEPGSPREQVSPAGITSLSGPQLPTGAAEQQRRLAIAEWIASGQNPLTARVIVNRLWQFHFGTGIVDTPSDLGANGTRPTHPKLLDWLAAELISSGWSLKHIHRLILTSNTWRQDSGPRADGLKADADSRLLWRFPPRRLEAEAIRDCILAVSGKLDLKMGGPGFSAYEVNMENVRHYFPKTKYGPDDWRRMVYMTKVRQERDSVFGVFDCPDGSQVTPRRSRSTTPLQALNLLNSQFVMQQAEFLAQRLQADASSDTARIQRACELCFSRQPDASEMELAAAFVRRAGWIQFCRAVLNANEFLFIP